MTGARLHARLGTHKRAVTRAIGKVEAALASAPGTWAVGCSGGKDSTAMLSICVAAGWRGPVFHFRYHDDYDQDSVAMARQVAAHYELEMAEVEVVGEFDAFDRVGHFFPSPTTDEEKAAANWWLRTHKKQINEFHAKLGWAGIFIGMRAEESRKRMFNFKKKGWLYDTKDRHLRTCCPLSDWGGRDVWARILTEGLPWLARYDEAPDRILQRSEDCWLGIDLWKDGMAQEMRRRDPEQWRRLVARFPELTREL